METVFEMLMQKYNEAAEPLKDRQRRNAERGDRRQEITEGLEVLNAKLRLSDRLIDESIVNGTGNADALRQEQTLLRQTIGTLEAESETLRAEIIRDNEEIEQAFKQLAGRVLKENFPAIRERTVAKTQELLDTLAQTWADLQAFQSNTGPCLSVINHKRRLVPQAVLASAAEMQIARKMGVWFGNGHDYDL